MAEYKGRVVYVGPMYFPNGGAGARRILGNALSFISAGYEVLIGSGQLPENGVEIMDYQGIKVYSLGERIAENKPVLLKHLTYSGMGIRTIQWLKTLNPKPDAIVLYSGDFPYLIRLIPWCRSEKIPLIYEACEWFDPVNVPGGRFSPYMLNHEITMRFLVQRVRNVLSISSFLDLHYRQRGCETVVIPPTIDSQRFLPVEKGDRNASLINISYTGSPGKKDLFDNYLEAFLQADKEGKYFKFNVAGLRETDILNYPSLKKRNITILPGFINCLGLVSHEKAINLVGLSDFSVLLRYPKRYAFAGFPTKVVESMIMGTPVICNLTSDLHKYVIDGETGIICKDHNVKSLIDALMRVRELPSGKIKIMGQNARRVAETSFDYRNFSDIIDDFMKRLKLL